MDDENVTVKHDHDENHHHENYHHDETVKHDHHQLLNAPKRISLRSFISSSPLHPTIPRLLLLCLVFPLGGSSSDNVSKVFVDIGQRVVLPCGQNKSTHIFWQYRGNQHLRLNTSGTLIIGDSGDLLIPEARLNDAGLYSCNMGEEVLAQLSLTVRDTPSRVINMSVHTNSVFAIVSWDHYTDPDQPKVEGYRCQHRRDTSHLTSPIKEDWIHQEVSETTSQCAMYKLSPNTTYYFRVAAFNRLGPGPPVSQTGTTLAMITRQGRSTGGGYGRLLAICLGVSLVGLFTLGSGIALLLVRRNNQVPSRPLEESPGEEESLELVPHITLNPSFNIDMLEHLGGEESSEHAFLVDHGGKGG